MFECLKPEMWQKVAKFKGAEYFCKALYLKMNALTASRSGFKCKCEGELFKEVL